MKYPKKLIEVALPLEAINHASAREKSIRHGHPSTLHLWWARRPLAAARAVIFAQMVDDPASVPEEFPTPEAQEKERKRLFQLIEDLVLWENTTNEKVLDRARAEIKRSWARWCLGMEAGRLSDKDIATSMNEGRMPLLPAFHDPFAGGGALPLEAQRLGLTAHASDLNPVAVMINKAMIEIPPRFAGKPPVNPGSRGVPVSRGVPGNEGIPGNEGVPPSNKSVSGSEGVSRNESIPGNEGVPPSKQLRFLQKTWQGAAGLAEDVRYYGKWMRDEAKKRIGHLYPKAKITAEMAKDRPDLKPYIGRELTVIAWLWARTVESSNPAYRGCHVPLVSSFWLSTKAGKEVWVEPVITPGNEGGPGNKGVSGGEGVPPLYRFLVRTGNPSDKAAVAMGTKLGRGANFRCVLSQSPLLPDYIKAESMAGRMGARLMAIVAEGDRGRVYLSPMDEHEEIARKAKPEWKPEGEVPSRLTGGTCYGYGLTTWGSLFTPRQLVALTTFSDLVSEARERIMRDAMNQPFLGNADVSGNEGVPPGNEGVPPSILHHPPSKVRPQSTYHRTHLPHFEAGEVAQHITFRLADSLPTSVLQEWTQPLSTLPESDRDLERRKRIEAYLDQGQGECHLRDPRIAGLVADALRCFDGVRYHLHEWVVMPNHVHAIITPIQGNSLSAILHSWKSFTAKEANRILGRTGAFWREDYFDRMIRDERHWDAAVEYVRNNPVKAGLCATPEEWLFGSAGERERPWEGEHPWERGRPALDSSWKGAGGEKSRAGRPRSQDDRPLRDGGTGPRAYAEAVSVYLAFALDKQADLGNSMCRWEPIAQCPRQLFGRQAIPMVWDYAEGNPLGDSSGAWMVFVDGIAKAFAKAFQDVSLDALGVAQQADATCQSISKGKVVSTDPPYYDNVGYADLSDFFYVWLRRSLQETYPSLFSTLLVPKAEELVATAYRHGSKDAAEKFFMSGMTKAIHAVAEQAHQGFPVSIYYAFKQAEDSSDGIASTGWETFLESVLQAGFSLSGTWPMRTENSSRMIGQGTNALASSIVLVCRPRPADAPTTTRKEFLTALRREIPPALRHLQQGNIAPVDLAQASIGPGMAVFTRYSRVLEADDKPMTVRTALQLINQTLDETLAEQEGEFDPETAWAVAWFEQFGFNDGPFGDAETLSKAKNTALNALSDAGIVKAGGGKTRLLRVDELPKDWDPMTDKRATVWEMVHHLVRTLDTGGESEAAELVAKLGGKAESARELAYRLYSVCERRKRAAEALAYNSLVLAWPVLTQYAQAGPREVRRSYF